MKLINLYKFGYSTILLKLSIIKYVKPNQITYNLYKDFNKFI